MEKLLTTRKKNLNTWCPSKGTA